MTSNTDVHTCSYYCERPECVRRQRDELRDRMESGRNRMESVGDRVESALAQQPAAPSGAVNVVGMPEFDGLLDHIYEYGTAAEGVIERANAFARAVLARYAPHQPAGVMPDGISDDVIKAVWRAAMTSAHNVCVNRSNRWNDDDGPDNRITEANECAKEIAHWLEADEGFIAEIRAMLAAQQQEPTT